MQLLIALVLNAVALVITTKIVPGISVDNYTTALLAAIVLGVVNTFVKPILSYLSAPVTTVTLGLFTFVINAVVLMIVSAIVPGLMIDGWLAAILGAVVLSVVSTILASVLGDVAKLGKK